MPPGVGRPSRYFRFFNRLVAVTFLLLVPAACRTAAGPLRLSVWDAPDLPHESLRARSTSLAVAGSARARLFAAINETISFQFTVRAGESRIKSPALRASPLTSLDGQIAPTAVRIYRMLPVAIDKWPGWHVRSVSPNNRHDRPLDVLVPINAPNGGMPRSFDAGATHSFWVDIAIPKGVPAGSYAGTIDLLAGASLESTLSVDLTVWPFVLPDEAGFDAIVEVDHRMITTTTGSALSTSSSSDDIPRVPALDLLQNHRLCPVLPELGPQVRVGAGDSMEIDWRAYDAIVGPLLDGRSFTNRRPLARWPIPLATVANEMGCQAPASKTAIDYLRQCAEHFSASGWLDRSFVVPRSLQCDGSIGESGLAQFNRAARAHGIKVATTNFPQDLAPFGWYGYRHEDWSPFVDIWSPPAQFVDARALGTQGSAGKEVWLSPDRPPFSGTLSVQGRAADVLVLAWQAISLPADATYLGTANGWPSIDASPQSCIQLNPRTLIYPGEPFGTIEPLASVRLKLFRRAMQDAAYCRLLIERGLRSDVKTIESALTPYFGTGAYRTHFADGRPNSWPASAGTFEVARRAMASVMLESISASAGDLDESFDRHTVWKRLESQTRRLILSADGVRVQLSGSARNPSATVECVLTVTNLTRETLSGAVQIADLPEGWTFEDADVARLFVEPGKAQVMRLSAQAERMPAAPGGLIPFALEYMLTEDRSGRIEGRLPYIAALPFGEGISIDGDLSDWPVAAGNVASGFLTVGGAATDRAARSPSLDTTVFALRSDDDLLLAINSECKSSAARSDWRRKRIIYDDLVPVGEDLIEILIDPFNTGTRSPTDLYHIVVKRNGSDQWEQGIRTSPPCGRAEPWAVDAELASRERNGRWFIELRIPLAAMGIDDSGHQIVGLNVTRFDAGRQEFSTWSGVPHNPYDPLSLGNLYLPVMEAPIAP